MATPSPPQPPSPGHVPLTEAQRNARYTYLVGRLHNRQITMEEATELFGTMQGMLRASESARLAAVASATVPVPGAAPPVHHPRPTQAPSAGSDDLFLVGLLAMGAGAGLLAAMSRRLAEGPVANPSPPQSRENSSGSSR